jgi:inorganic triphosphatase YgiF
MRKEPNTPIEVELKLDVDPDDLAKVLAHPVFRSESAGSSDEHRLHSIYFDTPDQALKRAGISLRIRNNGTRRIQTIKSTRSQPGIAMTRSEWEYEVDDDRPDFERAEKTALEPFVKMCDLIRPVFSLAVERTIRELVQGLSRIEVAADRGQIEGQAESTPFGELELELKEGNPSDLFGIALTLAEAAPLRLSFRTKAERGFEAVCGERPAKIKAEPVEIKPRMTSAEAFQVIGAACLRHLMANEAIVRQAPSPDAVHQMRVALRRLRAAISLFRTMLADDRRDRVKSELKWMASTLGEARDLDVYIAKVLEPAVAQHKDDAAFQSFLAEIRERRKHAYETVRETIASPRFMKGVLEAAAWIQVGNWVRDDDKAARKLRDQPISASAEEELERRWKRVLKRGKRLAELDPEERHQVRIAIKKLRYATEFFDSLFKGKGVKKRKQAALKTLEALQETLGELNDIAVGSHMHDSGAAEVIHQEQLTHVEELLADAKKQHHDLAALEPFWKS